jgi:hypothetical protein
VLAVARNLATLAIAVGLLLIGGLAGVQFAESGRWAYALVYGLIIPLGTVLEWRVQRRRGKEAGEAADRLVGVIALALTGALL